jgi:hypothetical protein
MELSFWTGVEEELAGIVSWVSVHSEFIEIENNAGMSV